MQLGYIVLAIVYGLVIVTAAVASIFLTFKGIRKWTSKRKVESKRRHLRIVK